MCVQSENLGCYIASPYCSNIILKLSLPRWALSARPPQHPGLGPQPLRPELGRAGERRRGPHHPLRHRDQGRRAEIWIILLNVTIYNNYKFVLELYNFNTFVHHDVLKQQYLMRNIMACFLSTWIARENDWRYLCESSRRMISNLKLYVLLKDNTDGRQRSCVNLVRI